MKPTASEKPKLHQHFLYATNIITTYALSTTHNKLVTGVDSKVHLD